MAEAKVRVSRYISYLLRHHPEEAGLVMDKHGWVSVSDLIEAVKIRDPDFTGEVLDEIVRTDAKQRYAFNENKDLIRANQGHSISVDVELKYRVPPEQLYHGTAERYLSSIKERGLVGMSRLYVHLSADAKSARKVGSRHGKPTVLQIDSGKMYRDGYQFFQSLNGVWLTERVPAAYLKEC